MTHQEALDSIRKHGDAFEREIFRDEEFSTLFISYPLLWAEYIGSTRDPKQPLMKSKWQKFSEHNYTAIVRCWNAREALRLLDAACVKYFDGSTSDSVKAGLDCQAHMVSFIALAQSAAENLKKTCKFAPTPALQAFSDRSTSGDRNRPGSLAWILISRNHFLHDALTPLHDDGGVLHIDVRVLTMRDPRWEQPKSVLDATKLFHEVWAEFSRDMNNVWAALYSAIRTKVTPSSPIISINMVTEFSGLSQSESAVSGTGWMLPFSQKPQTSGRISLEDMGTSSVSL